LPKLTHQWTIPNIFRPFNAHQQPFPVQPHSDIALLKSMHESNSRRNSVPRVLTCWPQTVHSVSRQEVVSVIGSLQVETLVKRGTMRTKTTMYCPSQGSKPDGWIWSTARYNHKATPESEAGGRF